MVYLNFYLRLDKTNVLIACVCRKSEMGEGFIGSSRLIVKCDFMKKGQFHLLLPFLMFAVLLSSCGTKSSKVKPNVLLITVDDMNYNSVGVFGAVVPGTTPNIDKLASQGMRFENAHVTIAVCQPSRGVLATGMYPHRSGIIERTPVFYRSIE